MVGCPTSSKRKFIILSLRPKINHEKKYHAKKATNNPLRVKQLNSNLDVESKRLVGRKMK